MTNQIKSNGMRINKNLFVLKLQNQRCRTTCVSEQDGNKIQDEEKKWVMQYGMQKILIHSEWNITYIVDLLPVGRSNRI